jgi:hypothetical protein
MNKSLRLAFAFAMALSAAALFGAEKKQQQTFTGKAMCAKCELNQTDSCQTALQVTGADGKTTTYLLADNKVAKDFHGKICKTTLENVKVTGRVKTEDGKQVITASKIEAE